jgi:hypothetical protein
MSIIDVMPERSSRSSDVQDRKARKRANGPIVRRGHGTKDAPDALHRGKVVTLPGARAASNEFLIIQRALDRRAPKVNVLVLGYGSRSSIPDAKGASCTIHCEERVGRARLVVLMVELAEGDKLEMAI